MPCQANFFATSRIHARRSPTLLTPVQSELRKKDDRVVFSSLRRECHGATRVLAAADPRWD
ncbi:hypothetical protein BHYA_0086g00040 [Botrytis hyacinthi]|uniref:Uncharacterized protein n=1 Tax=Botrytis hyacinthi TaxID=278943 RepID=A0A4Z1GQV6_9HELO|nr:hypothetical protein BHYA_0086g00040 [Botrytis hyacinthi]